MSYFKHTLLPLSLMIILAYLAPRVTTKLGTVGLNLDFQKLQIPNKESRIQASIILYFFQELLKDMLRNSSLPVLIMLLF